MKLNKYIILTAAIAVLATGCGNKAETPASFSPTESSIYVTREGKITSATVEKYENDYYTAEELKASAEEDLEAINGPAGAAADNSTQEKPAAVSECSVKDGTIKLLIDFKDANTYLQYLDTFTDEEDETVKNLDITTVADGLTKGYLVDETFTKPGENKEISSQEVVKQSGLYVAAVEGAALIQPEGKIQYISKNVTMADGNMVHTSGDGVSYIVFK